MTNKSDRDEDRSKTCTLVTRHWRIMDENNQIVSRSSLFCFIFLLFLFVGRPQGEKGR